MTDFSIAWGEFGAAIGGIGALGLAAFGIVESAGKVFAFSSALPARGSNTNRHMHFGLPYVGLGVVKRMMRPLHDALSCAYGPDYLDIVAEQYRANRGAGSAPDTIQQGVRLGLPYLPLETAARTIGSVWNMDQAYAMELAQGLRAPAPTAPAATPAATAPSASAPPSPTTTPAVTTGQMLAGRFAAALDARVTAAFQLADERYETVAQTAAGVVAVLLAALFNWGLVAHPAGRAWAGLYPWPLAIGIGLVAVPIAPAAKDLSTALRGALTAFKSIGGK